MTRPEFDARDAEILREREAEFNQVTGPRVGDFLKVEGGFLRFTHDWGESIQTTVHAKHPCNGDASFYLSSDGHVSFSGSLDPAIDKRLLKDTGELQEGSFWFFHHNHACAENGVSFKIRCRVFVRKPAVYNVIRWPDAQGHWWLVAETEDGYTKGCYSPIRELHPKWTKGVLLPTYDNQLWTAAELLVNKGLEALENPHAMIGRTCGCGECFCCAAAAISRGVK